MFGNPETTTGGMALKFYASVRLDVRRVESIKVGQEVVGSRTRVRVVKNKVAPPFKVAEFDIMYNEGISKVGDVLDLGVQMGVVEKRGSFYTYGEAKIGQGRENAKQYLKDNPDLADEIDLTIRQKAGAAALSVQLEGAPDEAGAEDEI
jgi:recombination protein RecA